MIDWKNVFDQPTKNYLTTSEIAEKIATGKGDDYNNWLFARL